MLQMMLVDNLIHSGVMPPALLLTSLLYTDTPGDATTAAVPDYSQPQLHILYLGHM